MIMMTTLKIQLLTMMKQKPLKKGAVDSTEVVSDTDLVEAETLTVTAKLKKRQALEDEIAAFLASGGRIVEVPADESVAKE